MSERPDLDEARMLADARRLAFPRYPGSEGNERARRWVAERLGELGLEVREQEFDYDIRRAFRAIRAVLLTSALLAAGSGLVALRSSAPALALLALGAGAGGLLLVWSPGAERLYAGGGPTRTWNIAGHRPARRPRLTLILLAHYDSKSQNLSFPFRMGFTLLALAASSALLIRLILDVAGRSAGPGWLAPLLGGLAALALIVLSFLKSGNDSPGGVDNAGSVALLLELARALPGRISEDVELIFLSPGAEEDHMIGTMRWLDAEQARFAGRPVLALNFDGAGSPGRPVILESYGLFHRFAPPIARVARETARRLGQPLRRVWLPPAVGIDAIPFHHRGIPCLTFSSGSLGRATIAIHSSRDVADHLDGPTLVAVGRLAAEVAERLADVGSTASAPASR